ncbi:uncharacterized protein BP5553_00126 [Venustampulla echinocandica]|uniref:Uncharacterized protein n=1 Tax=Venustampulla echinocandica TaxID=2656787 RepID=A0A370TX93_9HELO|nr:uncharacterized protein BP5553_00126 [Venustampulla echinocandica]RDL40147.1 hypothetical protein BP5553_00126 [Venustampulla echinocandica]
MSLTSRLLVLTAGAILFLAGTYFRYPRILDELVQMADSSAISSVPIEVTLSSDTTASSNLGKATIRVTLTNTSPHSISVLQWLSPLDTRAVAIGAFAFTSTRTNSLAPCLNLKLNRKLPESGSFPADANEIIRIPPKGTVEKEVEAKEPDVALTKGERYRVVAQGQWMRVWIHSGEIDQPEKLSLEDGISGEYKSNELEIEIEGS